MHLHALYTGAESLTEAAATPPFGPGFTAEEVADADTLEVWVTSLEYVYFVKGFSPLSSRKIPHRSGGEFAA